MERKRRNVRFPTSLHRSGMLVNRLTVSFSPRQNCCHLRDRRRGGSIGQAFKDKALARMLLSKITPTEGVAQEVVISMSTLELYHSDLRRTQGTNHSNRGQSLFSRNSWPPRRRRSSLIERKKSTLFCV
jgi:hypothetical protein